MKNLLLLFSFMISMCLTVGAFAQPGPTCTDLNIPIGQDDSSTIVVGNHVPNAALAAPLTITLKNPYGGVIDVVEGANELTEIRIAACAYIGRTLKMEVRNATGPCWSNITFKQGNAPVIMGRSTTVFCNDPLVFGGHINGTPPPAMIPCGPDGVGSFVADWVDPRDCVLGEDTAKIIYREYEAFGKDGARGSGFDTIVVYRLPQITPDNTFCQERDTTYCGALLGSRFGPYMLAENPTTGMCDTVYFLDSDGSAAEFDAKCGLSVAVKVDKFDNDCESLAKYTVLLKQTCYGTPSANCVITPTGNLTVVSDGYYECIFWHVDLDTFPPVVTCEMDTVTVPTGAHDCAAHTTIPPVSATDSCHDIKLVKAIIEGLGTFPMTKEGDLWVSSSTVKLPHYEGAVPVIYEAFDECHNVGRDTCYVIVKDRTKPVAVCDKGINVSLTGKKVWVNAETFDEGSWDNCAVNFLLARRSDWQTACIDLCDTVRAVTYGPHGDTLWTPELSTDKLADPVEAHYKKTIDWLSFDGQECANVLVQAWRYGLMEYATTQCKGVDQFAFESLVEGVLDPSVPFDQAAQIGGGWSDQVPFSCADACGAVQVEILVMDYWCNWSKCWTDVWVEDKTPVSIGKDVSDVDIYCGSYRADRYGLGGLPASLEEIVAAAEAGSAEAFDSLDAILGGYKKAWLDNSGNYVDGAGNLIDCDITFSDDSCFCEDAPGTKLVYDDHLGWVEVDTVGRVCNTVPIEQTLNHGIVVVNCEENVQCEQDIWTSFDHCGQGVIYRKFKIWQGCPSSQSGHVPDTITRLQRIWVGNECELDLGMFTMPEDAEIESCGIEYDPDGSGNVSGLADPEQLGSPTYDLDDDCRLVGIGYYDKVFRIVGGDAGCFKILRTWCFADWCQIEKPVTDNWLVDPSYEGIVLKHVQKIILTDTVPPTITIAPLPGGDEVSAGGCAYDFATTVDVSDACGVLEYRWYVLDADGDPVADGSGSLDLAGGSTFDVEANNLGTGSYTVRAVVVDACQNEGVATYEFVVTTEKKPSVICITSITAELTPMDTDNDGLIDTGMAVVWAAEYQNGSSEPACDDDSLAFYIELLDGVDDDTLDPEDADSLAIGCDLLPGPQTVRIWVKSFPSGTVDFCDVLLVLQDNMNGCGDVSSTNSVVVGLIQTELEQDVEKVHVKASLSNGTTLDFLTEGTGAYNFATALGLDITIEPKKDTDHMNGISTADLVRIQKHILGKSLLETEYRLIAADVNNDQRISALDLLELRRLILGKDDKLQHTDSWVFTNAIDGQSSYKINDFRGGMSVNFTGIKKGDVNASNDPSLGSGRSNESLVLSTENFEMKPGQQYQLDFTANNFKDLEGYQFTLNFDPSSISVEEVQVANSALGLTAEHFGLNRLKEGLITTNWDNYEATNIDADQVLFSLTVTAVAQSNLSEVMTINSKVTASEAYTASNELLGVALEFERSSEANDFALYQNRPNPFKEATSIGFDLPTATAATLTVFDVTGKVVKVVEGDYTKGYNEVELLRSDVTVPGVLYYQLDSETFTATRKMIVID